MLFVARGRMETLLSTSTGTFTQFPRSPYCLSIPRCLICINGNRGDINLSSRGVRSFKTSGISGNLKPFIKANFGIRLLNIAFLQVWHNIILLFPMRFL